MAHLGGDTHTEGLARIFIEDREHFVASVIAQPVMDEVDAPDMVRVRWPKTDDGAVLVIEPLALLMTLRKLQAFFPPQALNLLVINHPALYAKKPGNLTIAIATILLGQPDQAGQLAESLLSLGSKVASGIPGDDDLSIMLTELKSSNAAIIELSNKGSVSITQSK